MCVCVCVCGAGGKVKILDARHIHCTGCVSAIVKSRIEMIVVWSIIQGKLKGQGLDSHLPSIAVVAHYDAMGLATVSVVCLCVCKVCERDTLYCSPCPMGLTLMEVAL